MPPWEQAEIIAYSGLLIESFARLTGAPLLAPPPQGETAAAAAARLFQAPFALVSHGTQADPIFRYANRMALDLWEMGWAQFTALPSRLSAEPALQDERDRLLAEARAKGFIDSYEGVRISATGRRFFIRDTVLWNVTDAEGQLQGQACLISEVGSFVSEPTPRSPHLTPTLSAPPAEREKS